MSNVVAFSPALPALVDNASDHTKRRFAEFFTANIRNPNTRAAYKRAVDAFLAWCADCGLAAFDQVEPMHVAAYIEGLEVWPKVKKGEAALPRPANPATVKQHLAAIRSLFDWLVVGQIVPINPAASVRGPKLSYSRGKTPILSPEEARDLFAEISTDTPAGLRDRALLGVLLYSYARISATVGMNVGDFYQEQRRTWFRLREKGGKVHPVPAHHLADQYLAAYLDALAYQVGELSPRTPLFRTLTRVKGEGQFFTNARMSRDDALKMVRRRAKACGIESAITPHSFRATGITMHRANGGDIREAQKIAGHADVKTTALYDHTPDAIAVAEVERVQLPR